MVQSHQSFDWIWRLEKIVVLNYSYFTCVLLLWNDNKLGSGWMREAPKETRYNTKWLVKKCYDARNIVLSAMWVLFFLCHSWAGFVFACWICILILFFWYQTIKRKRKVTLCSGAVPSENLVFRWEHVTALESLSKLNMERIVSCGAYHPIPFCHWLH